MFPFLDEIKKQGCDIEFAYARIATPESYSENRHFAIALLKNRTNGCYYLKYYICKWRESSTRTQDDILLCDTKKAFLLAEKANKIYPDDVQQLNGFDGYTCHFYQRDQKVYSWWVACPDIWNDMERVVQELINEIQYPSPLHDIHFITVSKALSGGI